MKWGLDCKGRNVRAALEMALIETVVNHFSALLAPLALFLYVCHLHFQVKVTEKKPGHEEQTVLSELSEGQWFGEKALWG